MPLSYKEKLTGVIYLETTANIGAFTDERLRIIEILGKCCIQFMCVM